MYWFSICRMSEHALYLLYHDGAHDGRLRGPGKNDCARPPQSERFYVDGPLLDMKYKSGVGWLPIPVVHGMTLGELALMINGEKWLPDGRICDVTVIP